MKTNEYSTYKSHERYRSHGALAMRYVKDITFDYVGLNPDLLDRGIKTGIFFKIVCKLIYF